MSIRDTIMTAQTVAMKARDKETLSTLRMLTSAIKNAEIDVKQELDDVAVQALVAKQVKQLEDAKKDFVAGGRSDLVEKSDQELALLKTYLPEQMSDQELQLVVTKVIAEVGAEQPGDTGKVMGKVMAEVKGRADGNRVKSIVENSLKQT